MAVIKIQLYLRRAYLWMVLTNSNSSTILFFPAFSTSIWLSVLGTSLPNPFNFRDWDDSKWSSNNPLKFYVLLLCLEFSGASFSGQNLLNVYLNYGNWSSFQKFLNTHLSPLLSIFPIVTIVVILKNNSSAMNTFQGFPRVYLTSM